MSPTVAFDVLALLGWTVGASIVLLHERKRLANDVRWMMLATFVVGAGVTLSSAGQSFGATTSFAALEELLRALQPLTWGGLLYVYQQDSAKRLALRRESLLRTALEGGQLGAWEWDIRSGRLSWAGLTSTIFSIDEGEAPTHIDEWAKSIHPDDLQAMWGDVQQCIDTGTRYSSRYRIVLGNGAVRRVEAVGEILRDAGGEPLRMVGTIRDVSEEARVRDERRRLIEIIGASSDFVCTTRGDGVVEYLNAAARKVFGVAPGARVDALRLADLFAADALPIIIDEVIPHVQRVGEWSGESRLRSGTGDELPVSLVMVAHRVGGESGSGPVEFLSMVLRDASEREQTLAELRDSEARYRDFASSAADWVWETGADLRFRFISPRIEVYTGLPPSEFIGRSRAEIGHFQGADEDVLAGHMADLEARRSFRDFRYQGRGSDGEVRWYETSGQPNYDESGRFDGYRGTSRDITRQVTTHEALRESEIRFRNLIEGSNQGIFIQRNLRPLFVNESFAQMLGYDSAASVMALNSITEFFAPGEVERLRAYSDSRLLGETDAPEIYEYEALHRDGRKLVLQHAVRRINWQGAPAVQVVAVDVTERHEAERALRESEVRYRALYDDIPTTCVTLSESGFIRSINRYGAAQLGQAVDVLVGGDARELYPTEQRAAFEQFLAECFAAPGVLQRWELPKLRGNGELLWARESARAVRDVDGTQVVLLVSEDVSEARDLSERLAYEASHDGLTGLCNRREFENRLRRVIETARESDSEHALCYFDLDQFKIVNDTCGHMAGDELLRQLGNLFKDNVRRRDTLARLGGDEFALLIEHCPMSQAVQIANNLHKTVGEFRFYWESYTFTVGVSIGVVPIDATATNAAYVLGLADQACYVAKDQGRNRVHVYRHDDSEFIRRSGEMQWLAQLGDALELDRFCLVRQPIVPLNAPAAGAHFELLLRLIDDDGSLVAPGAFLPAAERYSMAVRIDRWVTDAALDWLDGAPDELRNLHLCAINLSGQSLGDEAFLEHLLARIRASSVPPTKLCFEITETAAIANFSNARVFINTLRTLGCRFALDDFGSGLSSFGYLKTLPVDFLKIDGSFVKDIIDDPIDQAMVEAINRIGQVIGKQTVAEFVENDAILEKLREIGVNYAQGFCIGVPEPIDMRSGSDYSAQKKYDA